MRDNIAARLVAKGEFLGENDPNYAYLLAQDIAGAKAPEAYFGADLTGKPIEGELLDGGPRTQHFLYGVADAAGSAALMGGTAAKLLPGGQVFVRPVPGLGALDRANPRIPGLDFLDKPITIPKLGGGAAAIVAPTNAGQAVPKTGDLFEPTFQTPKGPVGSLAETVVEGDTLALKDVVVYGEGTTPLTGLTREALAARTQLMAEAKALGFKKLRITGNVSRAVPPATLGIPSISRSI